VVLWIVEYSYVFLYSLQNRKDGRVSVGSLSLIKTRLPCTVPVMVCRSVNETPVGGGNFACYVPLTTDHKSNSKRMLNFFLQK
jgi:hypothetical protein